MSVTWLEWLRWFLLIVCSECTCRYAFWWWKLRPQVADGYVPFELRSLMIGIVVGMAGFAFFACYALLYATNKVPDDALRIAVLVTGDFAIAVAAILHLQSCWRISCGMPYWRLPFEVAARGFLALIGAAFLT